MLQLQDIFQCYTYLRPAESKYNPGIPIRFPMNYERSSNPIRRECPILQQPLHDSHPNYRKPRRYKHHSFILIVL